MIYAAKVCEIHHLVNISAGTMQRSNTFTFSTSPQVNKADSTKGHTTLEGTRFTSQGKAQFLSGRIGSQPSSLRKTCSTLSSIACYSLV